MPIRVRIAVAAIAAVTCLGNMAQAQTNTLEQSQGQSQEMNLGDGGTGGTGGATLTQGQSAAQTATQTTTQSATTNARARATGGQASATGGNASGGNASVGNVTVNNHNRRQVGAFALGFMQPPSCGVAFSGGGAGVQGTGALGFSWETESCRKHRLATALANMGRTDAAIALLCSIDEIRDALSLTEGPCPTRQQAQPTMVSTAAPAPAAQPVVIAAAAQPAQVQRVRPAYCAVHASRGIPPTQECL